MNKHKEKHFLLYYVFLFFYLSIGVLMLIDWQYFLFLNLRSFDYIVYGVFIFLLMFQMKINFNFLLFFPFLLYFQPLSSEFGIYPIMSFMLLAYELLRRDRLKDYRFFSNLFLFYFYGYISLCRMEDSRWLQGNGALFVLQNSMYGMPSVFKFLDFNSWGASLVTYLALSIEAGIAILFLFFKERYAYILGIILHAFLLVTTGLIFWHLFLILFFTFGYFTVLSEVEKINKGEQVLE